MSRFVMLAALCFATAESIRVASAFEPSGDGSSVIDVDPEGQPPGLAKKAKGPTYYLWRDGDVWRLRSATSEKRHSFGGTIRVQNGRVKKLAAAGLEGQRPSPKRVDIGRVSRDRTRIDFSFKTNGRIDGFDFQVEGEDATLQFNLLTNGTAIPGRIRIGGNGNPAPGATFSLPAHSDKTDEPPAKSPQS